MQTQVRLTVRDDRLTESFTLECAPRDAEIDSVVAQVVAAVRELEPDLVGLSSLLTTTMPQQKAIIEELSSTGLRDGVKVIIGGAPVTQDWANEIGADGYAPNAAEAVEVAKALVGA